MVVVEDETEHSVWEAIPDRTVLLSVIYEQQGSRFRSVMSMGVGVRGG